MEKRFDLREERDRAELAKFLPSVDGQTIDVPAPVFVAALGFLADCLGGPSWLTYQWGVVGPFSVGMTQHPFGLPRIVQLALELQELSTRDNVPALLTGFANPPQFLDTVFEAHTASFFSRLTTTSSLTFSPPRATRGHDKRPDFEVNNEIGKFLVECKRPHPSVLRAAETFKTIAGAIQDQLKATAWTREARLEVERVGPLSEQPVAIAGRLVEAALAAWSHGQTEISAASMTAFVVPRDSPFRILDPKFGQDVMILDTDEATGLFDPRKTIMRVVHGGLDLRFARSVGARVAEALRQLPSGEDSIIALGMVPKRIAETAISRRIADGAYDHVLAFVVNEADTDEFHFSYRTGNGSRVQRMVGAGLRPLFTV
jgi:hypothetical protein